MKSKPDDHQDNEVQSGRDTLSEWKQMKQQE